MKKLLSICLLSTTLMFSSCAASTMGELEVIKNELHQVQSVQKELLSHLHMQHTSYYLFEKYSQSKNMNLYKEWEGIVNSKDSNVLYFIDASSTWVRYSLLESLRFEMEADDFSSLQTRVKRILQMGNHYNLSLENMKPITHVVHQNLNLRTVPILDNSTKKTILNKGTFIKAHYMIHFNRNNDSCNWIFITTDSGLKGWVNSKFLSMLKEE